MVEKIVVGPINKGLKNDRTAFVIDNDSFPTLVNAYQWRGRVKRKRGTELLGRLTRYFDSTSPSYNAGAFTTVPTATITITLDGSGAGNLLNNTPPNGWILQVNGNIIPGSVTITDGAQTYTDPAMDGTLTGSLGGSGTIVYSTGQITIAGGAGHSVSAIFTYYPDLPVMGLEDFVLSTNAFPGTIAFDTTYSYRILKVEPYTIFDVSFYKNLPTATYPGYIQKTFWTPTTWNGQDYQQFWTVNYQGALWTTNGINIPFNPANVGMQYKFVTGVSTISTMLPNGPSIVQFSIANHGLVVGDFLFFNEFTEPTITGLNFQTGYVITVVDVNNVIVEFPNAVITGGPIVTTTGIAQYLTNRSDITKDSLRWFDGDPVDGLNPPVFSTGRGWVNFSPPLSQVDFSIAETPADQYYLVGARMIVPFKDRLLFFGPVIQTSAVGSQIYLQDTIIYSQNGTPYYTASFSTDPNLATTTFFPILTPPINLVTTPQVFQGAAPNAYWEDQTGFGGFISAGVDQPINSVSLNEDVLITGFDNLQTRVVYSGNDIVPFNFFVINSELGTSSTFSTINTDQGVMTRGNRGYIITGQTSAQRIDLDIPDQVFQIDLLENGTERFCAQRDYINEWIYFTYPSNENSRNEASFKFPNQTLQYNYRDNSWALFNESYTTYGSFKKQTGFTWATVGNIYETWSEWNDAWDTGESTLLQPQVIAGNQQGFVLIRAVGTGEGNSLYIQNFSASVVTSPNHELKLGDYIYITEVIGTIGTQVNGKIFSVAQVTQNTFTLNPTITAGTYFGGGLIQRLYIPYIQTKQFPVAWGLGRKTRIGFQQYLLSKTTNSQITLLIFLSQDNSSSYNNLEFSFPVKIVPDITSLNNSLIYSTTLYTCPESTNLGLTPANTNLQMPTANAQQQIWHRVNTSLIGDTVQLGFTLSDEQMRAVDVDGGFISQDSEIEIHGFIIDVSPSQMLS